MKKAFQMTLLTWHTFTKKSVETWQFPLQEVIRDISGADEELTRQNLIETRPLFCVFTQHPLHPGDQLLGSLTPDGKIDLIFDLIKRYIYDFHEVTLIQDLKRSFSES